MLHDVSGQARPSEASAVGQFVHPDDDPRSQDDYEGERATLVGFLRDQRLTLRMKCAGLDAEQMARRFIEPSNVSFLSPLRHLASIEQA